MQEPLNIGIDVAKAELVIGVIDRPELNCTIANRAPSIKRWLRQLPQEARIAVEATGDYHKRVIYLASQMGIEAYVLHASDVHHYVKALGQRGKTDRTDAQAIARFLKEHHARLHVFDPGGQAEQQIQQLLRRRALLVDQREGLELSLRDLTVLGKPIKALIEQFERLIAAIDEQIAMQIHSQCQMAEQFTRLQTIPGVGAQGAAMLTCLFRRIAFKNVNAAVAYTGLDPRPMDSGTKRGRRRLSKRGPALLRRQIYMMGFSASNSKMFKPYYQALRLRGLTSTAAFIILGRKLYKIAFALVRDGKPFNATRFCSLDNGGGS